MKFEQLYTNPPTPGTPSDIPPRWTDDVASGPLLELESSGTTLLVEADVWRSWTGRRFMNGEEYHGPVYLLGSDSRWTGHRVCGCPECQVGVEAQYRPN